MPHDFDLLNTSVVRALSDSKQDVRKRGASDIEGIVKQLRGSGDTANIRQLIASLTTNFVKSVQPSQRKGGLLALAAVAVALYNDVPAYLQILIEPVAETFNDGDATVRFGAVEAMYNIAKVSRVEVLQHFAEIFDGLIRLAADNDPKVRTACSTLDHLVRDIATESATFDVPGFITLVKKHIGNTNGYIRLFLVGWLQALDSVPGIYLIRFLPEFVDGLFTFLSDKNREIVTKTETLLHELQREVHENKESAPEYGALVKVLITHCSSKDDKTRLAALSWLGEFLEHGKDSLLPFTSDLIRSVLPCMSDREESVRTNAMKVNQALVALLRKNVTIEQLGGDVIEALQEMLRRPEVRTRIAALNWILLLLDDNFELVLSYFDKLFPLLLQTLSDASSSEEVVTLDLSVLARLSRTPANFTKFMVDLVTLLKTERKKFMTRSSIGLIVRQLSLLLDPEKVFRQLATILRDEEDKEFVSSFIQTLNMILLTSAELLPLRSLLKTGLVTDASRSLFTELYYSWCCNPVATLSLCLLSMAYEHAYALVCSFGEMEVTVNFLTQIDKLVQLLESPIFAHIRLHLLEPQQHPYLIKALFGILMLLPQSSAYDLLKNRLKSVATLSMTNWILSQQQDAERRTGIETAQNINWPDLLQHFKNLQLPRP
eukprot:TRINITY_DN7112_c0_g1_i1.p1 TRINITY_DN7112_c0_g1~~TRINITY_DN7112_c0_g1_i1.p1  ORF type:complete len:660 (-),score=154.50 TRINITY_DN7112_c0_g1_i1:115-2094(-)